MRKRGVQPFGFRGRRIAFARERRLDLRKDERISLRPPRDHYARAACFFKHVERGPAREDIAVADDRDRDRPNDLRDDLPVRRAGIHLHPRPAVDGDERRAALLRHPGKLHGVRVLLVPALAEFDADRNGRRLDRRFDDPPGKSRVPHQCGAVAVSRDLRRRAAHVDIDDADLIGRDQRFEQPGDRFRNDRRIMPEELDAAGAFLARDGDQLLRFAVVVMQPARADHLREREIAALRDRKAAERAVRYPRHRREEHRRRPLAGAVLFEDGEKPLPFFGKVHSSR